MTNPWPVEIAPLGPVAVGTRLWRKGGQLRATAIVKATFAFVPGGVMTLVEPAEIRRAEAHHGDNPTRSIRAASDLSPFLECADVVFVGHAHTPGGAPLPSFSIRLALLRGPRPLLDKTLTLFGDRPPPPAGQLPQDPAPFQRMPLVYERTFGGIGSQDNPLGVGFGSSPGRLMPNIVHPERGLREVAGLAPISWYFPSRKRLLKGYARKLLEGRIAELPDDFDARFFQSAPEDQRIAYLLGDEQLVLEGLHPAYPHLEMRLPGVRARARIYTPDGLELPLDLSADTLFIEGDHERASITWRGSCLVAHEDALSGVSILAGLALPGQPITWPTSHERTGFRGPSPSPSRSEAPPPADFEGTQTLEDSDLTVVDAEEKPTAMLPLEMLVPDARAAAAALGSPSEQAAPHAQSSSSLWEGTCALEDIESPSTAPLQAPFAVAEPGSAQPGSTAPIPGAPWAPRSPQETMPMIDPEPVRGKRQQTMLLIDPGTSAPPQRSTSESRWESTLAPDSDASASDRAPFAIAAPGSSRSAPAAPIPGAPWNAEPAQRRPNEDPFETTLTTEIELPIKAKALPAPPVVAAPEVEAPPPSPEPKPAPPPAAPVAAEPARSWSWATVSTAEKEEAEKAAPVRPAPLPKPAVKGSLYGKFGGKR